MSQQHRLSRTDFATVFAKGKRIHSKHATLILMPNKDLALSVVVSKKVAKKAVDRNTLKRRVYALAVPYRQAPIDAIVLLKVGALRVPRKLFQTEIEALLAQNLISR